MRIGRIDIRFHPRPRDWAVEFWQWPHQEAVKYHKVKRAFVAVQIGPVELGCWIVNPGQYSLIPEDRPRDSGRS